LTKSSASVAFCQYLLGANNQVSENCFAYGEPVVLPVPSTTASSAERQLAALAAGQLWIETCNAQKYRVALSESSLLVPDPGGIGWVKTLGKPTIYAGVNLPQGETDMAKPASKEVAEIISRVFEKIENRNSKFKTRPEHSRGIATGGGQISLWKVFAWTLILLLLLEPAIANRLKR
jgi:hypothetical protein